MYNFDLVIKNAKIVDGTGNPWYMGDVGITDGKIAYVGKVSKDISFKEVIDAKNQVLSPGFIDSHTHSDFALLRDPEMVSKLEQGITTQMIGCCGVSPAPISSSKVELLDKYVGAFKAGTEPKYNWERFGDYLDVIDELPLGANVGSYVGHGTIKINVMGFDPRTPSKDEIQEMQDQLKEAMIDGAFGFTSGLVYPPGVNSESKEIEEITKALKEFNGVYLSHLRNESYDSINSIEELINVAKVNDIPIQVHHHKAVGTKNWGLVKDTLKLIEDAREEGIDITVDLYPYTAGSTTLRVCLPPWVHDGGVDKLIERLQNLETRKKIIEEINTNDEWENMYKNCNGAEGILICQTPKTPEYEGKSLAEIGTTLGIDPLEALFDIIIANEGIDTACYFILDENDIKDVMKSPYTMIGSDSIPVTAGAKCHPRVNGTYPRVLGKYVREEKTLTLEEAINKMTGFVASRFNIQGKGLIKVGMDADLVIFDQNKVIDKADYKDPYKKPIGISYVIVNGELAMDNGNFTGKTGGKVLRRV